MALWKYDGPVFINGVKVSDREVLYTHAKTREVAGNNFYYRGRKLDTLYPYISLEDYDAQETRKLEQEYQREMGIATLDKSKICPHCGNYLADSGLCPRCDDGDYSIYDEIKLMQDIDDENYTEV